jgi:hypothetical protein
MNSPDRRKQTISFRSKTWAMDVIRKNTPTREEMAQNKYLAPIAHRFLSPEPLSSFRSGRFSFRRFWLCRSAPMCPWRRS